MRDDYSKEIDALRDRSNTNNEQVDSILLVDEKTADQRERRTQSDPPSEREILIKQYYSQKIVDLETKLQLANGKGIAFYNEVSLSSLLTLTFTFPGF
jgi:hypothetical protein